MTLERQEREHVRAQHMKDVGNTDFHNMQHGNVVAVSLQQKRKREPVMASHDEMRRCFPRTASYLHWGLNYGKLLLKGAHLNRSSRKSPLTAFWSLRFSVWASLLRNLHWCTSYQKEQGPPTLDSYR